MEVSFYIKKGEKNMELETKRVTIIPCTGESVKLAEAQNYEIGGYMKSYLRRLEEDPSLLGWGVWLVIQKEDGLVIGDIGFKGKPDEKKSVDVGYGFLESYWNQGYATEAVGELIEWAFNTSKVAKVTAQTLHDNFRSVRVLEKLGMKKVASTEIMIHWEMEK